MFGAEVFVVLAGVVGAIACEFACPSGFALN